MKGLSFNVKSSDASTDTPTVTFADGKTFCIEEKLKVKEVSSKVMPGLKIFSLALFGKKVLSCSFFLSIICFKTFGIFFKKDTSVSIEKLGSLNVNSLSASLLDSNTSTSCFI